MRLSRQLAVLVFGAALLAIGLGAAGGGSLPRARAVQNGERVSTAQYPYMVGVSENPAPTGAAARPGDRSIPLWGRDDLSGVICGGTLTEGRFVVTAAHCVTSGMYEQTRPTKRPLWVIAGRDDLSVRTGDEVRVRDIWVHPSYRNEDNSVSDLAVLTLERELPGSLPLARADDEGVDASGTLATFLGYGRTSPNSLSSGHLVRAELPVRPVGECLRPVSGNTILCAGGRDPDEGQTCEGDSGGPLVAGGRLIGVHNGVKILPGELAPLCSLPDRPTYLARVRIYSEQLAEVIAAKKAAGLAPEPEGAAFTDTKEYSCATGEGGFLDPPVTGTIRAEFGRLADGEPGTPVLVGISYRIRMPRLAGGPFDQSNANVTFSDAGGLDGSVRLETGDHAIQDGEFHPLGDHSTYLRRIGSEPVRFEFEMDTPMMPDTYRCSAVIPGVNPSGARLGDQRFRYTCKDGDSRGTVILVVDREAVTEVWYTIAPALGNLGRKASVRVYDKADSDEPLVSTEDGRQDRTAHQLPLPAGATWHSGPWKFAFDFGRAECVGSLPGVP